MFTGIIETVAQVRSLDEGKLWLDVPFADELSIGQSIACNGACLTVIETDERGFAVEVMGETLEKTVLGTLSKSDQINIERSMPANGRFDGHIVQGHIDGVGKITALEQQDDQSHIITIEIPEHLAKYVVDKGSICIDGISLTVIQVQDQTVKIGIIPHTWKETNLHTKRIGDPVHIEVDVLAKYLEKLVVSSE